MEYPYLYGPWGNEGSKKATIESVMFAIEETKAWGMGGHFHVDINDHFTLEVHQDLTVEYSFIKDMIDDGEDLDERLKVKMKNWEEVTKLYALFLDSKIEGVKGILTNIARNENSFFSWGAKIVHIGEGFEEEEEFSLETERKSFMLYPAIENKVGGKRERQPQTNLMAFFSYIQNVENENITVNMGSWEEVEELYMLFLDSQFTKLREIVLS